MSRRQNSDDERWGQVESILDQVLGYEGDLPRKELLRELCGDQADLRNEVDSLLAAAERDDDLLGQPFAAATPDLVAGLEEEIKRSTGGDRSGRTIDRYRLLKVIGRGGMGVVYLAERADEQFEKQVALKLMPRGLETAEVERRFLIERQILARLEHPGIARLLDGGVNEEGYPYLVMEYVDGESIDRYCINQGLSVHERLRLILEVCTAVQYAHQNLVVHRDLKPNNILVTKAGEVKLLDFGVGKILEQADSELSTLYQPLTPDYASPEQIANQPVSTATDVYSLGILIYKLLTGTHPYRLAGLSPTHVEALIAETRIRPPSAAIEEDLDAVETGAPQVSRNRLKRQLEGDLDNIVLKALRKEPERRYGSVAELAGDIRRHLNGLPILARRSTRRYRVGKFIGRHRVGVVVAFSIALLMALAVSGVVWQGQVAARERDRARIEAAKAERVADFLADLFNAADPFSDQAGQLTTRELLDRSEGRIRNELVSEPVVRSQLLLVMGRAYSGISNFDKALELAETAVADLEHAGPGFTDELVQGLVAVSRAQYDRGEYEAAEKTVRQALTMSSAGARIERRDQAMMLSQLGAIQYRTGDPALSAINYRRALAIYRHSLWVRGRDRQRSSRSRSGNGGFG